MKIVHCADIHIGSVLDNIGSKNAVRKQELIDTFLKMIDTAKKDQDKVVLIVGDLFDVKRIAKSIRKEILDKIRKTPEIDFIYLRSNHDCKTEFTDEQELIAPPNLKIACGKEWEHFEYGDIDICAIDIAEQSGNSFYEKLKLDKEKFNIVMLHGDTNSEINITRLKGKNIDYIALGHIHIPDINAQKLDTRGDYGYCGCLEGRGFDEIGDRGYFCLDIENKKMKRVFCPIAKRKYRIVKVDITDCDTHSAIWDKIAEQVDSISNEDLVRVELNGKYKADTQKKVDSILQKLNERFFYAQVKDKSTLDRNSIDYGNEISLRAEFVKLVSDSKLSQDEKDKIIEYGIKALSGEEVDICD